MRIELEFEVGEGFSVCVNRVVGVFGISFPKCPKKDRFWNWQTPSDDALKQLTNEVKEAMTKLVIRQPSCFILKLEHPTKLPSINVSSNDVFLLRLPVYTPKGKITVNYTRPHRHELYHELMHIRDILSPRFPTIGCVKEIKKMRIIDLLWDFSIEGRLEKMKLGSPYTRKEAIRLLLEKLEMVSTEQAETLYDKFWGEEVTYEELKSTAQKLMQCPDRKL